MKRSNLIDITKTTFGKLKVLKRLGTCNTRNSYYACKCLACDGLTVKRRDQLVSQGVYSCGCLSRRNLRRRHEGTYTSWRAMWSRCTDPNHDSFKYYGGIGRQVYPPWRDYWNFEKDLGKRPNGTTLDRIDPHGDYIPDNCRWATPSEQRSNRR